MANNKNYNDIQQAENHINHIQLELSQSISFERRKYLEDILQDAQTAYDKLSGSECL